MMTVKEAFEGWERQNAGAMRVASWQTMRAHGRAVVSVLGGMSVASVAAADAARLRDAEAGLSASTVRQRLGMLRTLLAYASEQGAAVGSTDWRVRAPWSPRRVEVLSASEHCRLFGAILKDMEAGRWRMMPALISMSTGLRIGEVCGLRWGDVNLRGRNPGLTVCRQAHTVYVDGRKVVSEEPKSRAAYRTVPMPVQLRDALRAYRAADATAGHYVIGNGLAPVTERGVREAYRKFIVGVRVRKIKFHGLRHTYATMLVATGRDIKAITKMMGHSSVTTTLDLYVHPTEDYKRRTMARAFRQLAGVEFTPPQAKAGGWLCRRERREANANEAEQVWG